MIFITGVSGFIGGNLANYLIGENYSVSGLVRETSRKEHLDGRIRLFTGDIRNKNSLAKADISGVEHFIHCASVINPPDQKQSSLVDSNVNGTINVLEWAREKAPSIKKFIYISSVGAMGRIDSMPADENYNGKIINPYQLSKKESEFIVREFCIAKGIDYIIIRPSWVYGPGDKRVLKFIKAVSKRWFMKIGSCQTMIHPLYISDLLSAILLSVEKTEIRNDIFIIAGPEPHTINDTIDIISNYLGRKTKDIKLPYWLMYLAALGAEYIFPLFKMEPPIFRRRLDFFRENQHFDIAKARRKLGYNPEVGLDKGMKAAIEWYRDNNWLTVR